MTRIPSKSLLMNSSQESAEPTAAGWALRAGEARRLVVGPGPRWLKVLDGRVWLTASGDGRAASEDLWLPPGGVVWLETGTELVMEAWGEASFELLVPPQACTAAGTPWRRRLAALWQRGLAAAQVSRPTPWAGPYRPA